MKIKALIKKMQEVQNQQREDAITTATRLPSTSVEKYLNKVNYQQDITEKTIRLARYLYKRAKFQPQPQEAITPQPIRRPPSDRAKRNQEIFYKGKEPVRQQLIKNHYAQNEAFYFETFPTAPRQIQELIPQALRLFFKL
jgi:hypothetical protein